MRGRVTLAPMPSAGPPRARGSCSACRARSTCTSAMACTSARMLSARPKGRRQPCSSAQERSSRASSWHGNVERQAARIATSRVARPASALPWVSRSPTAAPISRVDRFDSNRQRGLPPMSLTARAPAFRALAEGQRTRGGSGYRVIRPFPPTAPPRRESLHRVNVAHLRDAVAPQWEAPDTWEKMCFTVCTMCNSRCQAARKPPPARSSSACWE